MDKNGKISANGPNALAGEMSRLVVALGNLTGVSLQLLLFENTALAKRKLKDLTARRNGAIHILKPGPEDDWPEYQVEKIVRKKDNHPIYIAAFPLLERRDTFEPLSADIVSQLMAVCTRLEAAKRPLLLEIPLSCAAEIRGDLKGLWEKRAGLYLFQEMDDNRYRTEFLIIDHFSKATIGKTYREKYDFLALITALQSEYQQNDIENRLFLEFNLLGKMVAIHFRMGNYNRARAALDRQMDFAKLIGEEYLFAEMMNNSAVLNEIRGNLPEAADYFQFAREIADRALRGKNHPVKAIVQSNLGRLQLMLGETGQALLNCRGALRMIEQKLGMRDVLLVPLLLHLGKVYCGREDYEPALDQYRRALQIVERKLEIDHPYITSILQHIGMTYLDQGKYEMARRYVYRTLEATERIFGPDHPYLAVLLNKIGTTHFRCGHREWALKYFRWALDIRRRSIGVEDLEIAYIHENIGRVLAAQDKPDEARHCFVKAGALYRRFLPEDHPASRRLREYQSDDSVNIPSP